VGVSANDRVGVEHIILVENNTCEVFEVDLMDNTGAWGNNLEVVEGFGAPFEELESFSVAREFKLFIEVLGIVGAGGIDLDRVIDDEVNWAKWVDLGGVSSKTLHGITHGGEINDCWNTSEVL